MKFYSEKLDKLFDTQEELEAEEKRTKIKKKPAQVSTTVENENNVHTKKQLANEVELAD